MNRAPSSPATARARCVLPQPGRPVQQQAAAQRGAVALLAVPGCAAGVRNAASSCSFTWASPPTSLRRTFVSTGSCARPVMRSFSAAPQS